METLFISYARGDDESFVKELYEELTRHGHRVWWDRKDMPSRALTFLQEIRDAIDGAGRVLLVVGPAALESEYVCAEWQYAMEACLGVLPVLRLGELSALPDSLRRYHVVDMRRNRDRGQALQELLSKLEQGAVRPGLLRGDVPVLPNHFVPRREHLSSIEVTLLADVKRPIVISAAGKATAVHGMGGIGKTVLAAALARSCDVRRAFTDGVVWLRLGTRPDLLTAMRALGMAFDDTADRYVDIESAKTRLPQVLENKVCLVVLDDVWDLHHAEVFGNALGPRGRLLVTTRDAGLAAALGAHEQRLDVLDDDTALALLASWAGSSVAALPSEARAVASECGNLPLALAMIGAMVGTTGAWQRVLQRLRTADLTKVRSQLPNYQYPDVLRALEASVQALDDPDLRQVYPNLRVRYLDLAIFPSGSALPLTALCSLWGLEGLQELDVEEVIDLFIRRSLARRDARGRMTLHDLQWDYVHSQADDVTKLHGCFLDAYRLRCPRGWATALDDGYLFQHLAYHLFRARRTDELHNLLLDFAWLEARLRISGPSDLIADFQMITNDALTKRVEHRIVHAAHSLGEDPGTLSSQLWGRLAAEPDERIQRLLNTARVRQSEPWFRPLTASLTPADDRLVSTLRGHESYVRRIVLTRDGSSILSGSGDGTVRSWDLCKLKQEHIIVEHGSPVTALALSADGRYVVSGANNATVFVFDLQQGQIVSRPSGHTGLVADIQITPDCQTFILASNDHTVRVYGLHDGQLQLALAGHDDGVAAIAVTPDGQKVVSASTDGTLKVWSLCSGDLLHTLGAAGWRPGKTVTLPDGTKGICSEDDGAPAIFAAGERNAVTGRPKMLQRFVGHTAEVTALALTPDGRYAVSGSRDATLMVWNIETGEERRVFKGHTEDIYSVAVSNDGRQAASTAADRSLRVWSLETGSSRCFTTTPPHDMYRLAFTPDDRAIITSSEDVTVRVWDLGANRERVCFGGHTEQVRDVAVTPDCRYAISASNDNTIRVWDLAATDSATLTRNLARVAGTAITVDGTRAVTVSGEDHPSNKKSSLTVWDTTTGQTLRLATDLAYDLWCVAITANGKRAVTGAHKSGTVLAWDLDSGSPLHALVGHTETIWDVQRVPGCERVISASGDGTLIVWDVDSGQVLHRLRSQSGWVNRIAVSTDGRWCASSSADGPIKIWDLDQGTEIATLSGHAKSSYALAVTPDGTRLISGGGDQLVRLWDLRDGREPVVLSGHAGVITAIAVTPDGERAVSASGHGDCTLRVWDLEQGRVHQVLRGHTSYVVNVTVLPNGKRAVSSSKDGTVRLWDLDAGSELARFRSDSDVSRHALASGRRGDVTIVAGDVAGLVHFLRLENLSPPTTD